jgi:glycosyltransferase involved in cell wall biosynthesis
MDVRISVVMGVHDDADHLSETVTSVLRQTLDDFEFIVVDDGSTDPRVAALLDDCAARDARIRIIQQAHQGLTEALITGCNAARGRFLARIDVGDRMVPTRLARQARVLEDFPDCAFVSCHTEFLGPDGEHLWLNQGRCPSDRPTTILPDVPDGRLLGDVPHHGSVMFRRLAYDQAGGYRRQFYYGQDWDLWYRLAECGTFFVVPAVLYQAVVLPGGISMRNAERQRRIAACSRGAFVARHTSQPEDSWLDNAERIRPQGLHPQGLHMPATLNNEPGLYFIGEVLRRNGDSRCRKYHWAALRSRPLRLRAYVRLLQSWLA